MKRIWTQIKKVLHDFFIDDNTVSFQLCLRRSDKWWILYWLALITVVITSVLLIAVRLSERRIFNTFAAYVASATDNEYDKVAWELRYQLVYREFGRDMEKYVRYIPNTARDCPTCGDDYQSQAYLACTNTGELYDLDVFVDGRKPKDRYGDMHMSNGFDEVSLSRLSIIRTPDKGKNTVELDREYGIVSVHKMKMLFCDNCIGDIFNAVEERPVSEFVIFDAEEKAFYPVDDRIVIQIGDYSLECVEKKEDYEIKIEYIGESDKMCHWHILLDTS